MSDKEVSSLFRHPNGMTPYQTCEYALFLISALRDKPVVVLLQKHQHFVISLPVEIKVHTALHFEAPIDTIIYSLLQ